MRTDLWTEEEKQYLRDHVHGHSFKELSEGLKRDLGTERTEFACQNKCMKLGLTNGRDTRFGGDDWTHWCEGISKEEFFQHFQDGYFEDVVSKRLSEANTKYAYGDDVKKHGRRGEPLVKVDGNETYSKARFVWEQAHGKIPPKYRVINLDRNVDNCNLDNLACIPCKYWCLMQRWNNWYAGDPELTKAAIKWCELFYALKEEGVKVKP